MPEFVAENLKDHKNQRKRSLILQHSFAQKNLTNFTNANSFEIENKMLPKHKQKLSQFTNFFSKYVSVCSQKKHLHNIISWRSRTTYFQVLCQYISVYLSKKIFVSKTYKILSGGIGGWGRLNNFFKAACCLALVKWLTIFHFN